MSVKRDYLYKRGPNFIKDFLKCHYISRQKCSLHLIFTANEGQRGTKEKQLGGGNSTLICLNYVIMIKIINKRLSVI